MSAKTVAAAIVPLFACCLAAAETAESRVKPVLLPERLDMGDVNIRPVQTIDAADWIWSDGSGMIRLFRNRFVSEDETVRIHVSADNRYVLKLDGRRIARGPERGTVDHWTYRTLDLVLAKGEHVLEAVVQRMDSVQTDRTGKSALRAGSPLAQLSWWKTPGFVLAAEGRLASQLTTGVGGWRVCAFDNVRISDDIAGTFGIGSANVIEGNSPWFASPPDAAFGPVTSVRRPVEASSYGLSAEGWRLFPSSLPPQYDGVLSPGRLKAVSEDLDHAHVYTAEEGASEGVARFSPLLRGDPVTIPPKTSLNLLWDLGDYYCAYPELETSGGKGSRIEFGWAESLRGEQGKAMRGEFASKSIRAFNDVFLPDGGADGFSTTWWRAGRWVRLLVRTSDEPLTIRRLAIAEVRYPTPYTQRFVCDDATLPGIIRICERAMQMCSHEMSFDCPFYEQQMYPGDTRLQLLTHGVLASDDRLIRRDLELFDYSRRSDGLIGFNFPTRGTQDGYSYAVIWPVMLGDYAMWHNNAAWLRRRFPGLLHTMEGFRNYENGEGLVVNAPGWNFQDWTDWRRGSHGCDSDAHGTNCFNNLLYVSALKSTATVADALGEPGYAAVFRARAEKTAAAVVERFWCAERGMIADTPSKDAFSEHNLSMALTLDILPRDRFESCARNLLTASDLVRTTVYFSHYLFDAYARIGRTDLILKRLDLWRGYVAQDLKTTEEMPDVVRDGRLVSESRSDCHAWGAHPIYHLHAHVLGVKPASPFFGTVRIAPRPGGLRFIRSCTPTPKGDIVCDLRFEGETVSGTVELPAALTGEFMWRDAVLKLHEGKNDILK